HQSPRLLRATQKPGSPVARFCALPAHIVGRSQQQHTGSVRTPAQQCWGAVCVRERAGEAVGRLSGRVWAKGSHMLGALLLAGIVAAPLGSLALLAPARRRSRVSGTWPTIRRFVLAVIATAVLAAAVAACLIGLGISRHNLVGAIAGLV